MPLTGKQTLWVPHEIPILDQGWKVDVTSCQKFAPKIQILRHSKKSKGQPGSIKDRVLDKSGSSEKTIGCKGRKMGNVRMGKTSQTKIFAHGTSNLKDGKKSTHVLNFRAKFYNLIFQQKSFKQERDFQNTKQMKNDPTLTH